MHNCCPECFTVQEAGFDRCRACGWTPARRGAVVDAFAAQDRAQLAAYVQHYEGFAAQDLATPVMSEPYLAVQAKRALDMLGSIRGMRGLDVGVGKGFLIEHAEKRGAMMAGIDVAEAFLVNVGRRSQAALYLGSAERLPFHETFDFLVSTDVFEHVLNPGAFLYAVNMALRTGGRLVLRVPYRENVLTYAPQYGCEYTFTHLRSFNRPLLEDMMRQAGFRTRGVTLDGFSLGIPQPLFNGGNRWLTHFYGHAVERLQRTRFGSPQAVAELPSAIARLVMRPTEICILAEKVGNLAKDAGGNVVVRRTAGVGA